MHRIEQKLDIPSALPWALEPLHDPFELYDEACKEYYGESSDQPRPHGKLQMDIDDEYQEEDDDDDNDDDDEMVVTKTMMRTMMKSSHFFHVAYPFWHLLTKGECQALILL